MNTVMLFTGSGCLVILTSHASITDPALLEKLAVKGIEKFIAFEIPVQMAEERYDGHFFVVARTLNETDDLRILDYNGDRAFKLFAFGELGNPILYDGAIPVERARERVGA